MCGRAQAVLTARGQQLKITLRTRDPQKLHMGNLRAFPERLRRCRLLEEEQGTFILLAAQIDQMDAEIAQGQ